MGPGSTLVVPLVMAFLLPSNPTHLHQALLTKALLQILTMVCHAGFLVQFLDNSECRDLPVNTNGI